MVVIQHLNREGPGLFEDIAKERNMKVKIIRPDLGDPFPIPSEKDLVLIMGGPMGIKDLGNKHYHWLSDEIKFIKYIFSKNIRIIGVCLGAQLMAYSAGGEIEELYDSISLNRVFEIGWGEIHINSSNNDNSFNQYLEKGIKVLHWHGDRIRLPEASNLIASSNICKEQFFTLGKHAYGLQCHLETKDNMVIEWIKEDANFIFSGLGEEGQKKILAQENSYGKSSKANRLELLNKIIELLLKS
tara:strand:- start:514 stop:1242 length:729 start_codon:yes stop_codon:yes gene_type:complete